MTRYIRRNEDGSYEYGFKTSDGKADPHGRCWSREEACHRLFSIRA